MREERPEEWSPPQTEGSAPGAAALDRPKAAGGRSLGNREVQKA